MWTAIERLYLEEVLGVSPDAFVSVPRAAVSATPAPVSTAITAAVEVTATPDLVLLTPPLNWVEDELLKKILASIKLDPPVMCEVLPPGWSPRHVLAFNGSSGVTANGAVTFWGFPRVAQMVGDGASVTAHKRETWAQLQKFVKIRDAGTP